MNPLELTGRAQSHVVTLPAPRCIVHHQTAPALLAMCDAAKKSGIDVVPVSGFRSFAQQLAIWNGKFRGERILNGRDGNPVNVALLDAAQRVDAILAWSALPGASRHHWGTEVDLIDRAALPAGAPVLLEPHEYASDGRYAKLSAWLDAHAFDFGFHRPYADDRGGVRPEPWHLSYAPVSEPALAAFTPQLLREALEDSGIEGLDVLRGQLDALFAQYVVNVAAAPSQALAAVAVSSPTTPS